MEIHQYPISKKETSPKRNLALSPEHSGLFLFMSKDCLNFIFTILYSFFKDHLKPPLQQTF